MKKYKGDTAFRKFALTSEFKRKRFDTVYIPRTDGKEEVWKCVEIRDLIN